MNNLTYKCIFITQGQKEHAAEFAIRINTEITQIVRTNNFLAGPPIGTPTSAADGRREVMVQWYVTTDEEEEEEEDLVPLSKINERILHLKEQRDTIIKSSAMSIASLSNIGVLKEGFDLCIFELSKLFRIRS